MIAYISAAFVLACIFMAGPFIRLLPHILATPVRMRGAYSIESNIGLSRDRDIVALLLFLPQIYIIYRYFLKDPADIWTVLLLISAFLLLRYILYRLMMPRRGKENYMLSRKVVFNYFILFVLAEIPVVALMSFFGAGDPAIRTVTYVLSALFYLACAAKRIQILSLSCSGLQTFLYLCTLEILPTLAFVITGFILV